MNKLQFNLLPLPVRARWAKLSQSEADPATIAFKPSFPQLWHIVVAMVLSGVLTPPLTLLVLQGFISGSTGDYQTIFLLVLAFGAFVFFALFASLLVRRVWRLPYREGTYLFATGLVETGGPILQFIPSQQFGAPELTHYRKSGFYQYSVLAVTSTGRVYRFEFRGEAKAQNALQRLLSGSGAMQQAFAAGDQRTMMAMDPFYECSSTGKWQMDSQPAGGPATFRAPPSLVSLGRWLVPIALSLAFTQRLYEKGNAEALEHRREIDAIYERAQTLPSQTHEDAPTRTTADSCAINPGCSDCLSQLNCGWCRSLRHCYAGNDSGPTSGACGSSSEWVRSVYDCFSETPPTPSEPHGHHQRRHGRGTESE